MYKNKGTKSNSSMYQKIHMVRKTEENPRVKTGLVDQVKFLVELSYHSNQHAKLREINSTMNQRLSRACIVHLVIKKTNWSYVKTMYCSGSHLGITINIKNTKFVKDLPMIDAQFRFNQCNSFREEYISVFSPYGSVLIL